MFTLLKSLRSRQAYLSEPVSFVAALAIAELFYKFHSFLLETGAFLLTWFVLGAIVSWCTPTLAAKAAALPPEGAQ